ncbi:MAG: DUF2157 domain-containing protein [Pseudomonadota bacterium]|nr:DUF2157 domain-containing protein [Pseudomonadota bacterium]
MNITRAMMQAAVREGLISSDQAEALWRFWAQRSPLVAQLDLTHVLYYLGGLVAMGAMTLFMTLGWERFGGLGIFFIALLYAAAGLWLAEFFLHRRGLPIPAGIMAAFVVALTPLAVYGLQQGLGLWQSDYAYRDYHRHVDWNWLAMEMATLAAGALLLRRYRMPFLVLPVAVTLWYMSMDLTPLLSGDADLDWELRRRVSLGFGLAMLGLAAWVDLKTLDGRDFAFWLYLFGVMTFWGGLSLLASDSELRRFAWLCVNLLLIGVGTVIVRRVFVVFGALGVTGYLGYLAYDVFEDSLLFPFVLTLIGLGVIWLGVLWHRHEAHLGNRLRARLPAGLRELLEARR